MESKLLCVLLSAERLIVTEERGRKYLCPLCPSL